MNKHIISLAIMILLKTSTLANDSFQNKIYEAEYYILTEKHSKAIQKYNEAYHYRPLDRGSFFNYMIIISGDSILKEKYIDTLLSFLILNRQEDLIPELKNYLGSNFVSKKLKSFKPSEQHNIIKEKKDKIRHILDSIHDLDQSIRSEAMKYVVQDSMYLIEPYKTKIHKVDSINYLRFCSVFKEIDCDKYITSVITEYGALMNHLLIYNDSCMEDKLNLMITDCIEKDVIEKHKLATNLNDHYNSSRYHERNSNYTIMIEMELTDSYLYYKFPSAKVLASMDSRRRDLGLEPVARYLAKLIWTIKNQCKTELSIVDGTRLWTFKEKGHEKIFAKRLLDQGYQILKIKCSDY